jgi:caffeoyl-CoA O-methyltransferase
MQITNKKIEEYITNVYGTSPYPLDEMEKLAQENNFPIIGPLVGRVLSQYAKLLQAKKILELGSGYGYSAIWFALGTQGDCDIICTEFSDENIQKGNYYFQKAKVENKISYLKGDALKSAETATGTFDIVFNDIDKEFYPDSIPIAKSKLRKGGLFITDNALWDGRVTQPDSDDLATIKVKEFNTLLENDPDFDMTVLPIRDGVSVALKLV